ncbi:MAG: hypothetical protein QF464_06770, partial [Myxococcota bacterium]|nr:hypothetical protein [Myxococcota bacterium]
MDCSGGCEWGGGWYDEGATWEYGDCDSCTCEAGVAVCVEGDCVPTCEMDGESYADGTSWEVDCNTCSCVEGSVMCTLEVCTASCEWGGASYAEGDEWQDDCNTCVCGADGLVACTEMACQVEGCFEEQACLDSWAMCWSPGESLPCGMCMPAEMVDNPCTDDAGCAAGTVCEWDQSGCLCEPAQVCVAACTAGSCDEGETCGEDGHCATTSCGSAEDCPVNFHCDGGGCLRKWCDSSEMCEGYCVKSKCHTEPGYCSPPPP